MKIKKYKIGDKIPPNYEIVRTPNTLMVHMALTNQLSKKLEYEYFYGKRGTLPISLMHTEFNRFIGCIRVDDPDKISEEDIENLLSEDCYIYGGKIK